MLTFFRTFFSCQGEDFVSLKWLHRHSDGDSRKRGRVAAAAYDSCVPSRAILNFPLKFYAKVARAISIPKCDAVEI